MVLQLPDGGLDDIHLHVQMHVDVALARQAAAPPTGLTLLQRLTHRVSIPLVEVHRSPVCELYNLAW